MKEKILLPLFVGLLLGGGFRGVWQSVFVENKNTDTMTAAAIATHMNYRSASLSFTQKARILIVPGHEPDYGGAEFKNIHERDLVAELGKDLKQFFQNNTNYEVYITRDETSWNPVFSDYFAKNWNDIIAWEKNLKQTQTKIASVGTTSASTIYHITALPDVATRLYGINRWSNEKNIDLVIHLHLNDYPEHKKNVAGKYSGLVIFTPALHYENSTTTKAVANAVFKRFSFYNPISDYGVENQGVLDDSELIAVGSNNTSSTASMLIEYGYIYEPQFINPKVRDLAIKDLAYQTYLGVQDYFAKTADVSAASTYDPSFLYDWKTPVAGASSNPNDIYALQTALLLAGDYPPEGKTLNDCPHTGKYGACTKAALKVFQSENNVSSKEAFMLLQEIYRGK